MFVLDWLLENWRALAIGLTVGYVATWMRSVEQALDTIAHNTRR